MDVYLNFTLFQTKYRWSSHKGHMYLGYTLTWHIMAICLILCWSTFCCLNSPDPTRHRLHYTLCAVVSGMKMLATDPLSLGSCKVGPPWIRPFCPAHSTDVQFDWESDKYGDQVNTSNYSFLLGIRCIILLKEATTIREYQWYMDLFLYSAFLLFLSISFAQSLQAFFLYRSPDTHWRLQWMHQRATCSSVSCPRIFGATLELPRTEPPTFGPCQTCSNPHACPFFLLLTSDLRTKCSFAPPYIPPPGFGTTYYGIYMRFWSLTQHNKLNVCISKPKCWNFKHIPK